MVEIGHRQRMTCCMRLTRRQAAASEGRQYSCGAAKDFPPR